MKNKFNLIATSLLLSSTGISVFGVIPTSNNSSSNNRNSDNNDAQQYANQTSVIDKALLVGQNKGFSTMPLLTNMYNNLNNPAINKFDSDNTGNDFIDIYSKNLDADSINNIQSLYQRNGDNQNQVDAISKKISEFNTDKTYLPSITSYLTNSQLSNPQLISFINLALQNIKTYIPNIQNYLEYIKYDKFIIDASKELLTDWDQQTTYGSDPLSAMQNYMSQKGTFSESWNFKNGHDTNSWTYTYAQARDKNWTWNDFYTYVAGANFNYMIKQVSGEYIGQMLSDSVNYTWIMPTGFDTNKFLNKLTDALNKVLTSQTAWPLLVKTLVPIIKTQVLKLDSPLLGIKNLTWDNKMANSNNNTVELKTILLYMQHLLAPEGRTELVKLITNLLGGPFGNDIIVHLDNINLTYTLPEMFSTSYTSWFIHLDSIASEVADKLSEAIKTFNVPALINKIFDFTSKYLTTNPLISLEDLSKYLDLTFGAPNFSKALVELKDIISNPTSTQYKVEDILQLLGVQFGASTFKTNSILDNLTKWLNKPNSSINQLLGIIMGDKEHPGIIDNMLKEQQQKYHDLYSQYFDMDNTKYFILSNFKMIKTTKKAKTIATLSYDILNKLDSTRYHISYVNDDFINTKDFKLILFHCIK